MLQAVEARCAEQVKWSWWWSGIGGEHVDTEGIELEGGDGGEDIDFDA